jgi:hypothetical protein
MTKVEVKISNGDKFKVIFDGSIVDFQELIRYDNGTFFVQTEDAWRILVKDITSFRFPNESAET